MKRLKEVSSPLYEVNDILLTDTQSVDFYPFSKIHQMRRCIQSHFVASRLQQSGKGVRCRPLAVCTCYVYCFEIAVRMPIMAVESHRIVEPAFIPSLPLSLKHGQLVEQIVCSFPVCHGYDFNFYLVEVVSEALEDGAFGGCVALEVVAVFHFLQFLLLIAAESLRYVYADIDYQVAFSLTIALYGRQALRPQAKCFTWLCACINLYAQTCTLYGWYLYVAAKCGCGEVEQKVVYEVASVAHKGVVRFFLNKHLYIASDTASTSSITLSRHVYHHAFSHSSRNINLNHFLAFLYSGAVALVTLVLHYPALAVTGRTHALSLHHAEYALCGMRDDS